MSTGEVLPVWSSFLFSFVLLLTGLKFEDAHPQGHAYCACTAAHSQRLQPHPRGAGRPRSRSYLQIVFRAEHVRISDADASEGQREKHRSLRLLPAVIAHLQRHRGRRAQPLGRRVRTRACSVAREAGYHAPALPGQAPARRPCDPRARPSGLPGRPGAACVRFLRVSSLPHGLSESPR